MSWVPIRKSAATGMRWRVTCSMSSLTLTPSGGVAELPYPRSEAGNYVLMRHERPEENFNWNGLQLDNNAGRLIYKGEGGQNYVQSSMSPCRSTR